VWIANTGASAVESYSPSGTRLSRIDGSAAGATSFSAPAGVALDAAGNVWVADTGNALVQAFSSTGTWLDTLDGNEPGASPFSAPAGVAVDAGGDVYVADAGAGLVQVLRRRASARPVAVAGRPQTGTVPAEMSFSGTASYVAQQYVEAQPDTTMVTYVGQVSFNVSFDYLADFRVYAASAARSKMRGTRSSSHAGMSQCSGPVMYNPQAIAGMRVEIFDFGKRTLARAAWPWSVATGCETTPGGQIQSPFSPPVGGRLPGFPSFEVTFPSSQLTRPGSKQLGRLRFSGRGQTETTTGGGSVRIDRIQWTISGTLTGVAPGAYATWGWATRSRRRPARRRRPSRVTTGAPATARATATPRSTTSAARRTPSSSPAAAPRPPTSRPSTRASHRSSTASRSRRGRCPSPSAATTPA
jgi:hypothetical protein